MEGKSILEVPTFRSCPEIVLNGWLDAMLHLYDYGDRTQRREVKAFYDRNLQAVLDRLPLFDDESAHLSRYSNLCPYQF